MRSPPLDGDTDRYHDSLPIGIVYERAMSPQPIAVYGASGHTGQFVLRDLELRGYPVIAIGRGQTPPSDRGGWDTRREWRHASCDDPDLLDEALRGTGAVINCAGPFLDTAPALIEAALRAGIHYFDVTAEQRSARQSLATYDLEARQRGTVVVPAMAFYGGLGDLLAAAAIQGLEVIDDIEIGVALDYWHPTEGTRATGRRNSARRIVVSEGKWAPVPRPAVVREWLFPEPFGAQEVVPVPLSEVVTISKHIAARNIRSFMNSAPLRDLNNPGTPSPTAVDGSGRSSQRFVMDVQVRSAGRRTRALATGNDIYAVTGPIVVEACVRILENPPGTGGAYAPAELFDAFSFLDGLAPHVAITWPTDRSTDQCHRT